MNYKHHDNCYGCLAERGEKCALCIETEFICIYGTNTRGQHDMKCVGIRPKDKCPKPTSWNEYNHCINTMMKDKNGRELL